LLLLLRRRRGRLLARAATGASLAMFSEFLLALQFLIKANGLILDDGIGDFQSPLKFFDQVALRALYNHVNEKAFAVFCHAIGEAPRAPSFGFLDLTAVLSGGMFKCGYKLVDLFLRRGWPADEDQVVYAFVHVF
jgi:hypothetical protein